MVYVYMCDTCLSPKEKCTYVRTYVGRLSRTPYIIVYCKIAHRICRIDWYQCFVSRLTCVGVLVGMLVMAVGADVLPGVLRLLYRLDTSAALHTRHTGSTTCVLQPHWY
jgi:hypothetical protein